MLFEFAGLLFPEHEQTTLALAQIKEVQNKDFIGKVEYIFRENAAQNAYFAVPLFGVVHALKVAFETGQTIAGIVSLYLNITNRYDLFMASFD
jgi:tRNA threonylcarbamoyladenosine modification (KEOPS) complex Cgi121 subunit